MVDPYGRFGVVLDMSDEGVAYVYQNIGLLARSRLGAVYGMSSPQNTPVTYVYQNIT